MKMFCISPSRIPIPLILLILTAASPSGGAGDLVGEAAQAPKKQRNSFLPILTAIIGIISTGDIAFDRAMQTAVGSHVQGHWPNAVTNYSYAATMSPSNRDTFLGASYSHRLHECQEASRSLRTFARLHGEQGAQHRRDVRCARAPTHVHTNPLYGTAGEHGVGKHLRVWVDNGQYVSSATFRGMADHIYDEFFCHFDPLAVRDGDVVFVNTFLLCPYFRALHPYIRTRYILITHNSDYGAPSTSPAHDFAGALRDRRIAVWFTQNPTTRHPRLHPIPQGFAVNTKTFSADWSPTSAFGVAQRAYAQPPLDGRPHWLYVNFNVRGEPVRKAVMEWATQKRNVHFVTVRHKGSLSQEDYREDVKGHRFVFCPPGNGLDTHRTYEVLQLGAIPVLLSTNEALDSLYASHLPILILKTFQGFTLKSLQDAYPSLLQAMRAMWSGPPSGNPLTGDYWENHVRSLASKELNGSLAD